MSVLLANRMSSSYETCFVLQSLSCRDSGGKGVTPFTVARGLQVWRVAGSFASGDRFQERGRSHSTRFRQSCHQGAHNQSRPGDCSIWRSSSSSCMPRWRQQDRWPNHFPGPCTRAAGRWAPRRTVRSERGLVRGRIARLRAPKVR